MKIDHLEWIVYEKNGNREAEDPKPALVLRLQTDEGGEGVCRLPAWHRMQYAPAQLPLLDSLLIGRDPLDRRAIWQTLYHHEGISLVMQSFVDVALWDLYGKLEGQPVHALLGTQRDRVQVYKSTPFNVGPPEAYAEDAREKKRRGYRGYKIHPYRVWDAKNDPAKDIPVYRAVREAVGDDYAVMADNFLSYTYEEAVRVGQILDDLAYTWYESPMSETDEWMDRYIRLRNYVRLPVVAPETNPAAHDARIRWIEAGATDMGRLDVFFGGLTSCWEVVQACERAGIPVDLHCSLYPHLQIMAATSEARLPYLEDYGEPLPWPMDADGYLRLPQGAGAGFDLDWNFIEANRLDWSALAPA